MCWWRLTLPPRDWTSKAYSTSSTTTCRPTLRTTVGAAGAVALLSTGGCELCLVCAAQCTGLAELAAAGRQASPPPLSTRNAVREGCSEHCLLIHALGMCDVFADVFHSAGQVLGEPLLVRLLCACTSVCACR